MKGKNGFSLVEIMVSAVILALVSAGFFSVISSGRFLNNRSAHRLAAYEIARQEIERRRVLVREDTWNTANGPLEANSTWSAWAAAGSAQNINYQRRVRIDPGAGTGLQGRFIVVQVRWNEVQL